MFFDLNDQQREFRKKVRQIYETEVVPIVDEYERKEAFPISLFRKLGEEHLLCLRCPKEYGGPGLDKVSECISNEELNRICSGIGAGVMVHGGLATDPILRFGSEELKRRYLPAAARGEKIGSFALTEPNAGSDAAGIRTMATKEGGGYRLNGLKTFITNGTICDFVTLSAYTHPEKRGHGEPLRRSQAIRFILAEMAMSLEVIRMEPFRRRYGKRLRIWVLLECIILKNSAVRV
jgi:butyryl-CoA dehydrogenase